MKRLIARTAAAGLAALFAAGVAVQGWAEEHAETEAMSPVEILEQEHKIVMVMIGAAEDEVASIRKTGEVDREAVGKMLDFFENFVDRCHHAKEEMYLFPVVRQNGTRAERDMIRSLRQDHGQGRVRLGDLRRALNRLDRPRNATTAEDVAAALGAYAEGLRMHAEKEDEEFFPAAKKLVGEEDEEKMLEGFARVERDILGEGEHEKYHRWAKELSGQAEAH